MTYREILEAAASKRTPPLNAEQLRKRNERAAKIQTKIAHERGALHNGCRISNQTFRSHDRKSQCDCRGVRFARVTLKFTSVLTEQLS